MTTTLLVKAAKAIGHKLYFDEASGFVYLESKYTGVLWNPLYNDGDALRLAIALGISLEIDAGIETDCYMHNGSSYGEYQQGVEAWFVQSGGYVIRAQEVYSVDKAMAVRLAIVKVAAQICKD